MRDCIFNQWLAESVDTELVDAQGQLYRSVYMYIVCYMHMVCVMGTCLLRTQAEVLTRSALGCDLI